jgi:hypothetical protein
METTSMERTCACLAQHLAKHARELLRFVYRAMPDFFFRTVYAFPRHVRADISKSEQVVSNVQLVALHAM